MPHAVRRASERALLLHAHPEIFIRAAVLLERLLPLIHAESADKGVRLEGSVSAALADDLAAWGAVLTDLEDGGDLEDGCDTEEGYEHGCL